MGWSNLENARPGIVKSSAGRATSNGREKMEDVKARTNRVSVMTRLGVPEVNQEAVDFENSNEFEEYQEDVYDERTGELLDTKLTMRADT